MSLRPAQRLQRTERTLIRQIFDAAPPDAINLGLGQPDLPTPPAACLAGVAGITRARTGYTTTAGDPDLRRAIAGRYPSLAPGPQSVVVTAGSQEALFASCLTLVDPGDEILYPDPGYPAYPVVARLVGARPVAYPLRAERGFRLLARDVEQQLSARTRLVILSSPANPTGACHGTEELEVLLQRLERRGIPWLSDEIYSAFSYTGKLVSPGELSPGNGLVISGLSKESSMTGWRIGWAVGPSAIIERVVTAHQYLVTCAPSVSQCAALAAFTPEGRAESARYIEQFRRRRTIMARSLSAIPKIRFELPQGAFYFFVDVSAYGSCIDLSRRVLERRKVITIPGLAFGRRGAGHLRLSFAARDEDIHRGVELIGRELTGRGIR